MKNIPVHQDPIKLLCAAKNLAEGFGSLSIDHPKSRREFAEGTGLVHFYLRFRVFACKPAIGFAINTTLKRLLLRYSDQMLHYANISHRPNTKGPFASCKAAEQTRSQSRETVLQYITKETCGTRVKDAGAV